MYSKASFLAHLRCQLVVSTVHGTTLKIRSTMTIGGKSVFLNCSRMQSVGAHLISYTLWTWYLNATLKSMATGGSYIKTGYSAQNNIEIQDHTLILLKFSPGSNEMITDPLTLLQSAKALIPMKWKATIALTYNEWLTNKHWGNNTNGRNVIYDK